jgi:hypothetical protein
MRTIAREDGVALLLAMMAMVLMTAIGSALVLASTSETIIATHFRSSIEARYAASATIERGMDDLSGAGDWSPLTGGVLQSSWIDGPPTGTRTLADGSTIDLTEVVNLASCQKRTACSLADLSDVTPDRPWAGNNPQWKLYAYGRLRDVLASTAIDSPYYVALLVGNGPAATLLALRAEAFGPRGAHAVVEVTVGRATVSEEGKDYNEPPEQGAVKVLSWREVR